MTMKDIKQAIEARQELAEIKSVKTKREKKILALLQEIKKDDEEMEKKIEAIKAQQLEAKKISIKQT